MNTTTMIKMRTHRTLNWTLLRQRLAEWCGQFRSRRELEELSDASLRDIGITRCDIPRELHKPFWMT